MAKGEKSMRKTVILPETYDTCRSLRYLSTDPDRIRVKLLQKASDVTVLW